LSIQRAHIAAWAQRLLSLITTSFKKACGSSLTLNPTVVGNLQGMTGAVRTTGF